MKRIKELDGIRGIAIILIIIWHYFNTQIKTPISNQIVINLIKATSLSWSGVDLFFVLSGFLITSILLENKKSTNYFKTFYIRRVCRIFPPYYLMVFLYILLVTTNSMKLNMFSVTAGPLPLWSYLTFTQNFLMVIKESFGSYFLSVTWSLAVEEQFYIVIPFLVRFCKKDKLFIIFLILVLLSPIIRLLLNQFYYAGLLFPFSRADSLCMGSILAMINRKDNIRLFLKDNISFLVILFGILLIGVCIISIKRPMVGDPFTHLWLSLFYSLFILLAILKGSKILQNQVLVWFGLRSYGIYLFHQMVSFSLHGLILDSRPSIENASVTVLALLVTCSIAEISFRFIEKPIINIGQNQLYSQDITLYNKPLQKNVK